MAREENYYSILGIDASAPDREVKRAYYRLARELHPDRAKTAEEKKANAERLAVISMAYNTLKDPQKRAAYDGGKREGAIPAQSTGRKMAAPTAPAQQAPAPAAAPAATASSDSNRKPQVAATAEAKPAAKSGGQTTQTTDSTKMTSAEVQSQRVITAQKAFVKGMQLLKNGDYRQALPFFETAVQSDPESEPHYHMKLALCLTKAKGSFNRAIEAAERACQMDAYNMDFKISLGEIYETVGITSKAVTVYEEILKWDPEHEKAKFRLNLAKKTVDENREKSFMEKMFPSFFKKK